MRLALAALLLGLAGAPLLGQTQTFKGESTTSERDRDRSQRSDRPQEHKPPSSAREQRGREPPRTEAPTIKQDRARPSTSRPPTTAPSPAELQQRQVEEQRRVQQGKQTSDPRVFQCSARPVCGGGGYGRCAGVQQTFRGGTEQSRRQDMVNECIGANTPDACNCVVQCRRVAQCSIF